MKKALITGITGQDGSYLAERTFDDSELRMLIDGVLASRHITAKHSKELIEKLCSLSNKYFRSHVKNIWSVNEWSKTDNQALTGHYTAFRIKSQRFSTSSIPSPVISAISLTG